MEQQENNLKIDQLLDGASGIGTRVSKESENLGLIVRDPSHSILERVEAFEDIINIEVGDTTLSRARNIEREAGLRQVFIKFEGGNPSGTQKDRIAFAQCKDALRRGYDTICVATCGNYGAAVALAARLSGLKCLVCIPVSYHTLRIIEMENNGAIIERVPGTYEDTVEYSKELSLEKEFYDANPGGANTSLQIIAYSEIANEIYDHLRDAPKIVAVPVSNGTLLAGIYRGFVSLYKRGKTSRIPRIVAGSSFKKNPIVYSFKKGFEKCQDLVPTNIKESKINEPLINWHSFDGDEALDAIYKTHGLAADISDAKLIEYSKILKDNEGLNVLPASTAGLIGLLELHKNEILEGDRYVAILTGRK